MRCTNRPVLMTSMVDDVKPAGCASIFAARRDINVAGISHAGRSGFRDVEIFRLVKCIEISCWDRSRRWSLQLPIVQMIEHFKGSCVIAVVDVVVIRRRTIANLAVVICRLHPHMVSFLYITSSSSSFHYLSMCTINVEFRLDISTVVGVHFFNLRTSGY